MEVIKEMCQKKCSICGIKEELNDPDFFVRIEKCRRCRRFFCGEHYQGNCCVECIDHLHSHPCQMKKRYIIPIRMIDL